VSLAADQPPTASTEAPRDSSTTAGGAAPLRVALTRRRTARRTPPRPQRSVLKP